MKKYLITYHMGIDPEEYYIVVHGLNENHAKAKFLRYNDYCIIDEIEEVQKMRT